MVAGAPAILHPVTADFLDGGNRLDGSILIGTERLLLLFYKKSLLVLFFFPIQKNDGSGDL